MAVKSVTKTEADQDCSFTVECLRFFEPLYGYLMASVGDAGVAEDLVQEVFLAAFEKRNQFHGGDLSAWLYRIAKNTVAMHFRKSKTERKAMQTLKKTSKKEMSSSDSQLENMEFYQAALNIIQELDEQGREAMRLKFSECYSNLEIAKLLKVTPGHLGVILHRSLKKVRKEMESNGYV